MVSVSPADSVAVLRPCQIVPGCVAMTSAGISRQRCAQRWRCFTICHQAVHTLACPGMPARSGFTGGVHNFTVEVRPGMSSVSDRLHWHWPTRLSINRELYSNSGLTLGFSHLSGGQWPAHAALRFGGMYSRPQQLCNFNMQLRTRRTSVEVAVCRAKEAGTRRMDFYIFMGLALHLWGWHCNEEMTDRCDVRRGVVGKGDLQQGAG